MIEGELCLVTSPLSSEEIKLLTEVGFLAASRGDAKRAKGIFIGLQKLRPQRAFAYVGLAVALMNTGRHDEAATLLTNAVERVDLEEQGEVNAFLGLALQLAGRTSESLRALHAASECRLAQVMLGQCTAEPNTAIAIGSS